MKELNPIEKKSSIQNQEQRFRIEAAERAVKIVEKIYNLFGPKLGAHLVEANVVLTFAGARGQTEFYLEQRENLSIDINKLNDIFMSKGIRFNAQEIVREGDKKAFTIISIESLLGYEHVSNKTKIPGFFPFDSSTGWEGLKIWAEKMREPLLKNWEAGFLPAKTQEELKMIIYGVIKGYPDTAIYDAIEGYRNKEGRKRLANSDIPNVKLYGGAEPNYVYFKKHESNPEILEHQKDWGEILRLFYESEWHQKIKDDPLFIKTREDIKKK